MILNIPKYFEFKYLINLLISLIPFSFIAGNLAININTILITICSIIFFGKDFFKIKLNLIDKLLIILFIFSFFSGVINNFNFLSNNTFENENLFKSFVFFRYLFFYFSIKLIVEKNIFDFKIFFYSTSLAVLFVSLDLILQLVIGKDIFGNLKTPYKLSGPFGDEQIAGSYLQRFSIFLFFSIPIFIKKKSKNFLILILSGIFVLIFFSLTITGNRMPIILFIMMFFILFILEKKLRKFSIFFTISTLVLFLSIFYLSPQVKDFSLHFLQMINQMFTYFYELFFYEKNTDIANPYLREFYSGYASWKENFFIGGGINSFYLNCIKTIIHCANHPHNYYLEILSEIGLIGFILVAVIFLKILTLSIINKNELSLDFNQNLIIPFILLFIVEIFPIKTTGSFFTTGNASYIFFIIAIIVGLSIKSKKY
jgi:O-antigen ligase